MKIYVDDIEGWQEVIEIKNIEDGFIMDGCIYFYEKGVVD